MTGPSSSDLFSQLLKLETAVAPDNIGHSQRPATAPSNRSRSKISRIESLKATAASLSNRIESEARKLVREGINYGTATSLDVDTISAPGPFQATLDDARWAETAAMENDHMVFRIQRNSTSTGHSLYNGTAHPGAGSLYAPKNQKHINGTHNNLTNPQTTSDITWPILNSYTQERRKLVNGLEKIEGIDKIALRRDYDEEENQINIHDSSAGSISEGPILSEGSFSEEEVIPAHPSNNHIPRAADCMEAVDSLSGQRTDYQRLSKFQKEAARCSALSYPFAEQDNGKPAWEELNKGSPLSVINIFTKNLHDHIKG